MDSCVTDHLRVACAASWEWVLLERPCPSLAVVAFGSSVSKQREGTGTFRGLGPSTRLDSTRDTTTRPPCLWD